MKPVLAALAVCVKGDDVLLVQRRNPPDAGMWGFPGGKVELGETVETAAARELLEETGVTAQPADSLGYHDLIQHDAAGQVTYHCHLVAIRCDYTAGDAVADSDALQAGWVPVVDVLAGKLEMSEGVATLLRHALK